VRLTIRGDRLPLPSTDAAERIVGGPDTIGRETWLWDLQLRGVGDEGTETDDMTAVRTLEFGDADGTLVLRFDPRELEAELERCEAPGDVTRVPQELVAIVPRADVVAEDARVLRRGDVLVLEGDDPLSTPLRSRAGEPSGVSVARLRRRDGRSLRWIP
jgi:hypothetical protein